MNAVIKRIWQIEGVWQISEETNGYLIVKNGKSLLIDCPALSLDCCFAEKNLPFPELVLHTQIQEEHCREWSAFPTARVVVWKNCVDIALKSPSFIIKCQTYWDMSQDWDAMRGIEEYGFAGCITERPPLEPLNITDTLVHGDIFLWEGQSFKFLETSGSGRRSCSIHWLNENIVFSGDLIYSGGYLVNLYDLERCYGKPSGYTELKHSLRQIEDIHPLLLLPTSGPIIKKAESDCKRLMGRINWIEQPKAYRADEAYSPVNYKPIRNIGRYKEILSGLYQNNNYGNVILYIDSKGNGLIIDPDNCVWLDWQESIQEFETDLLLFENEFGLKKVDIALVTHYHGDHVRFCDLLRNRYGTQIMATNDVATILERPHDFPYPCRLPWYGLPFESIKIDKRIKYEQPFDWHGVSVLPIHTPGHCFAHAGFVITWGGVTTVCTGDTLQYGSGPIKTELPILYNDTALTHRGHLTTLGRLSCLRADLILGGHSHSFFDTHGKIISDLEKAATETKANVLDMIFNGDTSAMTPPHYDSVRLSVP